MRLRVFKNVDFPQPEGPMSAVTQCFWISIEMPFRAWNSP